MPPTTLLRLKVGSVPVSIELDSGAFTPQTLQRYRPFLTTARPEYRIALTRSAKVGYFPWQPRLQREGKRWTCRASDFSWERSGRTATATIKQTDQALDSFLRTFYSNVCGDASAQIFHSAALSWSGKGYLFAGVSGAGKTTLSRAIEGERGVSRLTDELAWVSRGASEFTVNATPFWGLFRVPENGGQAPLKKIFFLRKGRGGPSAVRLTPKDAQRRLMRCLVNFTHDSSQIADGWDFVLDLTRQVPCAELIWHRTDPPRNVLTAVEGL